MSVSTEPTTTEQHTASDAIATSTAATVPETIPQGPLSNLVHTASSSTLIQRARSAMPESMSSPAVVRVQSRMQSAIHHGDAAIAVAQSTARSARETLDTDEGVRLRKSAHDFWLSLYGFVSMIFRLLLTGAETSMGVPAPDASQPTAKRAVRVAKTAVSNVAGRVERRERSVAGTMEADAYKYARGAANLGVSAATLAMDGLKTYEGPGRTYIAPVVRAYETLLSEETTEGNGVQTDALTVEQVVSMPVDTPPAQVPDAQKPGSVE